MNRRCLVTHVIARGAAAACQAALGSLPVRHTGEHHPAGLCVIDYWCDRRRGASGQGHRRRE